MTDGARDKISQIKMAITVLPNRILILLAKIGGFAAIFARSGSLFTKAWALGTSAF